MAGEPEGELGQSKAPKPFSLFDIGYNMNLFDFPLDLLRVIGKVKAEKSFEFLTSVVVP